MDNLSLCIQRNFINVDFTEVLKLVKEFIKGIDVDVTELSSYVNHGHADQGMARFHEPDDIEWDEDEEYRKQLETAKGYIEADGLFEYVNITEETSKELQPRILAWIEKEMKGV